MATTSNRSSGSQITKKGVNQGVVLVDPATGNPLSVVLEGGQYKLVVKGDGSGGGGGPTTDVNIVSSIPIGIKDQTTGNIFKINADGSINANIELDAADGDNVMAVGTEDGEFNGIQHPLKVGSDKNLRVKDETANTTLTSIDSKTPSLGQTTSAQSSPVVIANNQSPIPTTVSSLPLPSGASTEAKQDSQITEATSTNTKLDTLIAKDFATETTLSSIDSKLNSLGQKTMAGSVPVTFASNQTAIPVDLAEPILIAGSDDGTITGQKYGLVNNIRQQVLASHDREQDITYADFGTKDQRITQIDFTSSTFPTVTIRKVISYTLQGNRYRRDSINWVVV